MKPITNLAAVALTWTLCTFVCLGQQSTPTPQQSAPPPAAPAPLPDAPSSNAPVVLQPTGPTAVFDTSMGRMTCKLFDKEAPETVANFIGLAEGKKDWTDPATHKKMHNKPLYNGTVFHRVIPDFMIQGGDPTATGMGDPGYMFKDEFNPNLNFDVPGRLAMANSGPDTNGSQFFITEVPTEHLNQKHTIFGQCDDSSVAVVRSIARVERDGNDKPNTDVVLTKVTIVADGKPLPPLPAASTTQSSSPSATPKTN
ncbi:Peptidyl-prolyl cis-trans isomerase [Acidisarcina polymorpha]|uniref:Peptidyl-prolyl cis-trans isomerase n=1 Tax=Acidisarcina polymorpha TaxID=2211140 RepID=A0A2Z5G7M5_9BACT|nr:peptidylprolyl isomerase [Acidisarcina polymorpha]AXC15263.1 Peptidyl-prolyl cis-trans isomerase [Acidisarcina polymorpha]